MLLFMSLKGYFVAGVVGQGIYSYFRALVEVVLGFNKCSCG